MKRTFKRSELYSNPSLMRPQKPIISSNSSNLRPQGIPILRPPPTTTVIRSILPAGNPPPTLESLASIIKNLVEENSQLKASLQTLKTEVEELRDTQVQHTQKIEELEIQVKNRRPKIPTNAVFTSTPGMTAANVQVRFGTEIATFFLKDFINFDMENKNLEEVGKVVALKMFEQLIPEGCTFANFSISSTPKYGYMTIPSNLFDELVEKLILLTQGEENPELKHAMLLRINFGLNDKIIRTRKQVKIAHLRNSLERS